MIRPRILAFCLYTLGVLLIGAPALAAQSLVDMMPPEFEEPVAAWVSEKEVQTSPFHRKRFFDTYAEMIQAGQIHAVASKMISQFNALNWGPQHQPPGETHYKIVNQLLRFLEALNVALNSPGIEGAIDKKAEQNIFLAAFSQERYGLFSFQMEMARDASGEDVTGYFLGTPDQLLLYEWADDGEKVRLLLTTEQLRQWRLLQNALSNLTSKQIYNVSEDLPNTSEQINNVSEDLPNTWHFETIKEFMGWHYPKNGNDFIKNILPINIAFVVVLYYFLIGFLFLIAPYQFLKWHEIVANSNLLLPGKLAKWSTPFFLQTSHCLNAVVRKHIRRTRDLFERLDSVKLRSKWIPAPLRLGDDVYDDFTRPRHLPQEVPYVAGLIELKQRLSGPRWLMSIEGPGGSGKSSLAFQIARWAADERADYRLDKSQMLPVVIESLGESISQAIRGKLEYIFNVSKISDNLLRSLLRKRKILIIVDGISEILSSSIDDLRPDLNEEGTKDICALVVTSRMPTRLPDSLVLRPLGLEQGSIDNLVNGFVNETLGPGSLNAEQLEMVKRRLVELMQKLEGREQEFKVPLIFLKLMIQKVSTFLENKTSLSELPNTLPALVLLYVEDLTRQESDQTIAIKDVRKSALVCLGKEFIPSWRPEYQYLESNISTDRLQSFLNAGLLMQSGSLGDPQYKFALDPIAEYMAAVELSIQLRDNKMSAADLNESLSAAMQTRRPAGFLDAFSNTIELKRDTLGASQTSHIKQVLENLTKVLQEKEDFKVL